MEVWCKFEGSSFRSADTTMTVAEKSGEEIGFDALRFIMGSSNIIVLLGGVALIATGAFAVASTDSFLWMVIDNRLISQAVYLVIAAGTLFFVIGILGLFGALMMDKTVLLVYAILLFAIFVLNICGSVLTFIYYDSLQSMALESLSKYNLTNVTYGTEITVGWNKLQESFECCGVNGIEDWENVTARSEGSSPPPPCSETENVVGCETVVRAYLLGLGSVGTTLLILQVIIMAVAAILYEKQRHMDEIKPLKAGSEKVNKIDLHITPASPGSPHAIPQPQASPKPVVSPRLPSTREKIHESHLLSPAELKPYPAQATSSQESHLPSEEDKRYPAQAVSFQESHLPPSEEKSYSVEAVPLEESLPEQSLAAHVEDVKI